MIRRSLIALFICATAAASAPAQPMPRDAEEGRPMRPRMDAPHRDHGPEMDRGPRGQRGEMPRERVRERMRERVREHGERPQAPQGLDRGPGAHGREELSPEMRAKVREHVRKRMLAHRERMLERRGGFAPHQGRGFAPRGGRDGMHRAGPQGGPRFGERGRACPKCRGDDGRADVQRRDAGPRHGRDGFRGPMGPRGDFRGRGDFRAQGSFGPPRGEFGPPSPPSPHRGRFDQRGGFNGPRHEGFRGPMPPRFRD